MVVRPYNVDDLEVLFQDVGKIECDYCKNSSGKIIGNPIIELTTTQITIDGMDIQKGRPTEYKFNSSSNSWNRLDEKNAFETEAEARLAGQEKIKETRHSNELSLYKQMGYTKQKASWNLGYHLDKIKQLVTELNYHRNALGRKPEEINEIIKEMKERKI